MAQDEIQLSSPSLLRFLPLRSIESRPLPAQCCFQAPREVHSVGKIFPIVKMHPLIDLGALEGDRLRLEGRARHSEFSLPLPLLLPLSSSRSCRNFNIPVSFRRTFLVGKRAKSFRVPLAFPLLVWRVERSHLPFSSLSSSPDPRLQLVKVRLGHFPHSIAVTILLKISQPSSTRRSTEGQVVEGSAPNNGNSTRSLQSTAVERYTGSRSPCSRRFLESL